MTDDVRARLEYLRGELRAERISYGELAELQSLAGHIDSGDVELLEAAGVPEHPTEAVWDSGEPHLELAGVRVFLLRSADDGAIVVQIETPEDSDVHERMRVYMNDGQANGWT